MSAAPITPVGPATTRVDVSGALRGVRPGLALAFAIVGFFVVSALLPALLAPYDPFDVNLRDALQAPTLAHPLGTDQSGRDVLSRVIYGARESLYIGLAATALSLTIALVLGVAAGLSGKFTDGVINRFIEVLFAFPVLLLALLFVTVFGAGTTTLIVAVGVGTAPGYARMIRGQVLAVKNSGYVEAAGALGHSYPRIVRRHILPNAMRPLVVLLTLGVGQAIVWASGLAFLGLGVAPPSPEWGAQLDAGRTYITQAWWLEVMPGLAIVSFALALTAIGRWIQQRLEGGQR